MNFRMLSDTGKTRVTQMHQVASLHITFECDEALNLPVGAPVKVLSTGKVGLAAPTDVNIGIVHVKRNNWHNGKPCIGILTKFVAEITGVADGAVTAGQEVTVSGVNADSIKYKAAVTGDMVIGVALSGAATGADVTVGTYLNGYKK